mmetsp:Transcript_15933/g.24815  ORF Transcript_15933/g.24815 Transcript_15933/m.24815 type:complete len:403 (+) Transcript_15933:368-1576(+)
MWNADSKGDQAYFFKRKERGSIPFRNGAIVSLVEGEIVPDNHTQSGAGLYMVVSDNNAKWKGEPIPTKDEETQGHWCAFLGQVPVVVDGPIRCGEHIGPKQDGSGFGVKAVLGQAPVIGIALFDKSTATPGIVKTLVFAGLNALSQSQGTKAGYDSLLSKVLEEQMVELQQNMEMLQTDVRDMQVAMDGAMGQQLQMEDRLNAMEENIVTAVPLASLLGAKGSKGGSLSGSLRDGSISHTVDIESATIQPAKPEESSTLPPFIARNWKLLLAGVLFLLVAIIAITLGVVLSRDGGCPTELKDHFDMQITCPSVPYRDLSDSCKKELNLCGDTEQYYCRHCAARYGGPKQFFCKPGGHFTIERCNWDNILTCEANSWLSTSCQEMLDEEPSFDYYAGYGTASE